MNAPASKICTRTLVIACALTLAACAGGPKSTSVPPSQTAPTAIQLSPSNVTLTPSAQQLFVAKVTGGSDTAVTWTVDTISGGNPAVGTITATGLYTAPATAGIHTVKATTVADKTKTASATVTVEGTISLTPGSVDLTMGATQQFNLSVQGKTNPAVTWSVDGTAGGNSSVGTITAQGVYTAPSAIGSHTISAAVSNPAQSATASVTVFSISVSPGSALVDPGATQQFNASIQGLSNSGVTWSVDGVSGGNSTAGTINSSGLYTAPSATGTHTISATSVAYSSATASSEVTIVNVAQTAVLTYHNDDARDGAYTQEVTLTPANVNSNQFGKLLSYPVDGQIYAQPLYVPQMSINGGTHDVVFVETQNNSVYAFDADATSTNPTTFWHVNLGAPIAVYDSGGPWPNVGILSTPVIDVTTNTMYVVAHVNGANPAYQLHALDVITGADTVNPVGISGSYSGDTLGNGCYQRMGLALNPVTNLIYIAIGSCPNGWIFAYDKTSLEQEAVFESTNGAQGGGFWASGGAPAIDDTTGNLYVMSGTDWDYEWISPPPAYTQVGYNDSFLYLNPTSLAVESYFSPDNNYTLSENDADLGSGSNVLVPGNSQYPLETLGGGKDGNVFVLNPLNMGGFNSTNNVLQTIHIGTTQYNNIFSTPVYWDGSIYFHCNNDVLRAFSWNPGDEAGEQLSQNPTSSAQAVFGMHGATPSLSANGNTNGIIWDIDNSSYDSTSPVASGPAVLHAYNASNVANELYNSTQAGSRDQAGQALKFTVPTIANGRVFVPTATELDIYGLLNP
jgi:hypothetical protein